MDSQTKLTYSTVIILLFAMLLFLMVNERENIVGFGAYFGGIATTVAIGWIILNSTSQRRALDVQQKELELQRAATQDIADFNLLNGTLILYRPTVEKLQDDALALWAGYLAREGGNATDELPDRVEIICKISEDEEFGEWLSSEINKNNIHAQARLSALHTRLSRLELLLKEQSKDIDVYSLLFNGSHEKRALRRLGHLSLPKS
ncbi:hypothetical protein [Phaeobacter inhibens]|uniref:hypothetical protein n=1 Tax=Phaeobacter inhibens TaxID=221822 RepID=UPI0021A90279|nr:hypothetical protein [Phaeobacter inhibens]UWR57091.1 hypothetical protein K4F89_01130 [Phaeobacter inhibens]